MDKAFLQNHFMYRKWLYIGLALFAAFGWSLIFTMTRYVPPKSATIDVFFLNQYFDLSNNEDLGVEALADFDDSVEEISFMYMDITSLEGSQKFAVTAAANDGDLFIMDKTYLNWFVTDMLAENLDSYIESGALDLPEGVDLSEVTMIQQDDYGVGDGQAHVFAIPADNLYGFIEDFFVDNRDKVIILTSYSQNKDNAVKMINWLYDRYYYEQEPDFVKNYDKMIDLLDEDTAQ